MADKKKGGAATTEPKKTECPVTREEFVKNAKPITVVINGETKVASPKEFSTGSFGWYLGEKVAIQVGDTPVKVQIGMNLTVVGSNPKKEDK